MRLSFMLGVDVQFSPVELQITTLFVGLPPKVAEPPAIRMRSSASLVTVAPMRARARSTAVRYVPAATVTFAVALGVPDVPAGLNGVALIWTALAPGDAVTV